MNSSRPVANEENGDNSICLACRNSIQAELDLITQDPSHFRLNVAIRGHNHSCFICGATESTHSLSLETRVDVYIQLETYVPPLAKCCNNHLDATGLISRLVLPRIQFFNRPFVMQGTELQGFMQVLLNAARMSRRVYEENLSDEEFVYLTSLTRAQFEDLYNFCVSVEDNGVRRRVKRTGFFV